MQPDRPQASGEDLAALLRLAERTTPPGLESRTERRCGRCKSRKDAVRRLRSDYLLISGWVRHAVQRGFCTITRACRAGCSVGPGAAAARPSGTACAGGAVTLLGSWIASTVQLRHRRSPAYFVRVPDLLRTQACRRCSSGLGLAVDPRLDDQPDPASAARACSRASHGADRSAGLPPQARSLLNLEVDGCYADPAVRGVRCTQLPQLRS